MLLRLYLSINMCILLLIKVLIYKEIKRKYYKVVNRLADNRQNLAWTNEWYRTNGFTLYHDYGDEKKMWRSNSDKSYFVLCSFASVNQGYRSVNGGSYVPFNSGNTGAIKKNGAKYRYYQEFDTFVIKPAGFSIVDVTYADFFPTVQKGWDGGTLRICDSDGSRINSINVTGNHNHTDHHHPYRINVLSYMKGRYAGQANKIKIIADMRDYNYAGMNTNDYGYAHTWLYPYDGKGISHKNTTATYKHPLTGLYYQYDNYNVYFEVGMHARNNTVPHVEYMMQASAWVGDRVLVQDVVRTDPDGDHVTLTWSGITDYSGTLNTEGQDSTITFTKAGWHTLSLHGTDPFGSTTVKTRSIQIKDRYYPTVSLNVDPNITTAKAGSTTSVNLSVSMYLTNYNSCGKTISYCNLILYECNHNLNAFSGDYIPDNGAYYNNRQVISIPVAEIMQSNHTFNTSFDSKVYNQRYQATLVIKYTDKAEEYHYDECSVAVTNTPPNPPRIVYPLQNSSVYLKNPPIVLLTGTDPEKDNVFVACDAYDYNSDSSARRILSNQSLDGDAYSNFSNTGYLSGANQSTLKIRPTTSPNPGREDIYAAMIDTSIMQGATTSTSFEVKTKTNMTYISNKDILTSDHINYVIDMLNSNAYAYGIAGIGRAKFGDDVDYSSIMSLVNNFNVFCDNVNSKGNANQYTDLVKINLSVDIGYDDIISILNKIINSLYV